MKLLTTDIVDEKKYEILGMVSGMQVRSLSFLRNFLSGVASFTGTGSYDWTGIKQKFINAREEAINEMIDDANKRGAHEIIGIRVEISEISRAHNDGMLVCSVTGTAVKLIQKGGMKKIDFNIRNKKNIIKNKSTKNVKTKKRKGLKRT